MQRKRLLHCYLKLPLIAVLLSSPSSTSSPILAFFLSFTLGTATSCVAILRDGRPEVVPNEYGNPLTASYVSWDSISKVVVGDSAKDTASTNPKATISSLKTILGRRFRDPFVQSFATSVQYPIVDRNGLPHVRLDYKSKDGEDATLVVRFLHPFLLFLSLSLSF